MPYRKALVLRANVYKIAATYHRTLAEHSLALASGSPTSETAAELMVVGREYINALEDLITHLAELKPTQELIAEVERSRRTQELLRQELEDIE